MNNPPLSVEFPSGIPIISGVFGMCTHDPRTNPLPLIHSDWDLIFIDEGHGEWMFKDRRTLNIPKGYFLLLPPFVSVWRRSPTSLLRLWYCHFSFVPIPKGVFHCFRNDCMENKERVMIPLIFSKDDAPNVWRAYRDLLTMSPIRPEGPKWRITSALQRLLTELAAFAMQPRRSDYTESFVDSTLGLDHRLDELCRKIIDNPGYPWKSAELAKSVGLSVGHLHRIFQSGFGTSLKQYILQIRFRLALNLLKPSGGRYNSIKEISAACGFSSQELFARQFKKFFGIAPSEFRKCPNTLDGNVDEWGSPCILQLLEGA